MVLSARNVRIYRGDICDWYILCVLNLFIVLNLLYIMASQKHIF